MSNTLKLKNEDRRKFTRIPLEADVKLVNSYGQLSCSLIDLSLRGILATLPEDWQANVGDRFLIELTIKENNAKICMYGTVVRVEEDRVGFSAQHTGESSITNLSRIVKKNIGDTEILNRELSALFG